MKLKNTFVTQEMDGEQVMVEADGGFAGMVRSNATAAFIIDQLKTETTKEAILDAMCKKYDAPRAVMAEDVDMVLGNLKKLVRWMPKLTLEESLAKNGFLTYRIRGVSMQPMLRQGRDLFTVVPKGSERCKKYDVVLYRRPSDPYVLHRIIEVRPDSYVILGDNCIAKEYGIRDEDILGVLTSFQHNGHTVSVSDWRYRLYSRGWVFFQPVRIFCKRVKGKLHQ